MGIRHDVIGLFAQLSRPKYGTELQIAGQDLPAPTRVKIATRHGEVRCLHYPGTRTGCYVHFHGGAFITRYPQMDDFWARFVVDATGLDVILPDYDVAPQARYPVAHEQAYDVTAHFAAHVPTVVGGFSGGGNLAASVALRARDLRAVQLCGQLLGVPSVDVADDIAEKCRHAPASMIGPRLLTLVRKTYFKDASRRAEPYASPLRAPDLAGLAPAYVITAQDDTLRREGDEYARRLVEAGVPVEHHVAPGVDHYFLHGAGRKQARDLMSQMSDWLAAVIV